MVETPTFRLADLLLDGRLTYHLRKWDKAGLSRRSIARELCEATDGQVDVTDETIRRWLSAI